MAATYASDTMRRVVVVSSACGLLAINAVALLLLVGPLSSGSSNAAVVSSEPSVASRDAQLAVAASSELPPGAQDMDLALLSVGATQVLGSWPSWCGAPPQAPWQRFGVTADGTRVGVVVASAGDGKRLWQEQLAQLSGCTQFRVVNSTPTSLTLRRTDVPVTWVVARYEDVLASVLQVSEGAPIETLETIATDLVEGTASECLSNPDDDTSRNPYRPGYLPWHPAVPIDTPDPSGPKVPEVSATVEWTAPPAIARPELAVIWPPNVTYNPYTMTDVTLAPIRRVPVLVDPAELLPPAVPRPAASPPAAIPLPTSVTAYFARPDTVGPGCGWAFAGTVPPVFDPALPGKELEGRIDGAFATAADKLASWLVWSVDAREYALEDAQTRAALEAWTRYDQALEKATVAWQAALDQHTISLDTWYAYVPVAPSPAPSGLPSGTSTDVPTVGPTASPSTSPTATGVR
ncbi:MAG TPA: hypothetical protein DDY88_08710 [Actinobacteria bacterium]|nr:hypothetical protein [Actinomycetota bacterium]